MILYYSGSSNNYFDLEFITDDFDKIVKEHHYEYNIGVLTDIDDISFFKGGFNLSVGYYNPHRKNEYIVIDDMIKAYNFIIDLLNCDNIVLVKNNDNINKFSNIDYFNIFNIDSDDIDDFEIDGYDMGDF